MNNQNNKNEALQKTKDLKPEDFIKDPYILEFLDLKKDTKYLESELEEALISRLNEFLLELGKGFAFVYRQKRISTETKNYYVDSVLNESKQLFASKYKLYLPTEKELINEIEKSKLNYRLNK